MPTYDLESVLKLWNDGVFLNHKLQTWVSFFFCNRNSNIAFLLEHKEVLKANCVREEEKAADLELRSRLFSFGEFKSDAQVIILCQWLFYFGSC